MCGIELLLCAAGGAAGGCYGKRKLDSRRKGSKGKKGTKDSERETWTKSSSKPGKSQKPRLTAYEEYTLEAQQAQQLRPKKQVEQKPHRRSPKAGFGGTKSGVMDANEFQRLKEYEALNGRANFVY